MLALMLLIAFAIVAGTFGITYRVSRDNSIVER